MPRFFFNDTATTEIYTLSLHDALPIYRLGRPDDPDLSAVGDAHREVAPDLEVSDRGVVRRGDRKSTRLNSSHVRISYALFCLKKQRPSQSPACTRTQQAQRRLLQVCHL